jgi:hypothetical protein
MNHGMAFFCDLSSVILDYQASPSKQFIKFPLLGGNSLQTKTAA